MRNIIRIGAGTDGRNRFVAIALGVALAAGPAVALPAAALAAPATDAAAASTTAGTTITLQGADGASLAGHTFNVYQIGTYTGVVLKGNQISSLGIQGTTESNAWADDAITIANGYDKDTSDDITKVGGYDAAGSIAAIDMAKQAKQLSNIQAALNASSRKPATVAGGADLTTQDATLNITVPEEGLYYITDSAGSPIIIGTKSGAGTAMSGAPGRTLGVAVIKSKSVTTDKKVVVDRDGRQVSKQGDAADPVAVTVGDTVTHTIDVTVPNTAVKFKLADAPAGQEYVKGSLKVALSGTATDVTADTVIYDGETQHGAKALPGDATLKKEDRTPADPDITVPAGGWALNATKLITTQGGKKITITYQSVVTKATAEKPSENSVSGTAIFKDGAHYTVVTNGDKVDLKSYDFTLKKVAQRSQGSQLAVEPVAFGLFAQFPLPDLVVVGVQPLVGPDLPVEASQPADAGHDGAVRTCQRMVDDDLAAGRPLVGDGEPGSVAQRLVFAHEPPALLVPFAHVQRERPVLMLLVHDRLLFRNPRARCPGRAWWPRRFCVRSTMPRRSSAAPACAVRRTRHGPRCARGGRARRPG